MSDRFFNFPLWRQVSSVWFHLIPPVTAQKTVRGRLMKSIFTELIGPSGLILIGAILAACGAYWTAVQRSQSSQTLSLKNQEIVNLNQKIARLVTGEGSYCYLTMLGDASWPEMTLMLMHTGESPVYDLDIRMVDSEKFALIAAQVAKNTATIQDLRHAEWRNRFTTIHPKFERPVDRYDLGSGEKRNFEIYFSSRSGPFTQSLRLRKIDGFWLRALVIRGTDNRTVFEQIDPGFPVSDIDWERLPVTAAP